MPRDRGWRRGRGYNLEPGGSGWCPVVEQHVVKACSALIQSCVLVCESQNPEGTGWNRSEGVLWPQAFGESDSRDRGHRGDNEPPILTEVTASAALSPLCVLTCLILTTATSLVAQTVKASAYNAGDPGDPSLRGEDPLGKEMATHSRTLA